MKRMSHRRYYSRQRISGGKLVLLTLLFWGITGFIMFSFVNENPNQSAEVKEESVAKLYISSIFPYINRGSFESREAIGDSIESITGEDNKGDKQDKGLFKTMVGSMFPAIAVLDDDLAEEDPGITFDLSDSSDENMDETQTPLIDTQTREDPKPATANIDYSKPVVIIYHTHATESYQPVSDGNFHSINEYGTVREVGNVMTAELEAKGIQVIHNKTLHDSPSYNQSYSRSLETIQNLMGNNKSAIFIVDLHRDAASYTGNMAKTLKISNDTVAKYSLVVGTGNPNVEALRVFAKHINSKAEELYPGFGGKII